MRLAPVPMYYWPDSRQAVHFSGESSRTTHGTKECVDACRLFAAVLCAALDGRTQDEILAAGTEIEDLSEKIEAIARCAYRAKDESQVRGTGYVVDSLEAAVWCFATTTSFEEAVLRATNLGDDADTTAAAITAMAIHDPIHQS